MAKNNKDGLQISWFWIIVTYAFCWPAGLLLTFLKVLPWFESVQKQNGNTGHPHSAKPNRNPYSAQNSSRNPNNQTYHTADAASSRNDSTRQSESNQSEKKEPPTAKKKSENLYKPQKALPIVLFICAALVLVGSAGVGLAALTEYIVNHDFLDLISSLITSGALALAGGAGIVCGSMIKEREQRYQRYSAIIGDRESVYIPTVAKIMNMSNKKVTRDLQKMVDNGVFGEFAYIDKSSKHLMRSMDAVMENPNAAAKNEPEKVKKDNRKSEMPETEYESILRRIRELNDAIEDQEVSKKIDEIENTTSKIFDCVAQNPDKLDDIRTFMNYYLPTTLKLLTSYSQIEKFGIEGDNISSAKQNIEKILSILAIGFNQQLDRLYASDAMDISSDIEVLEQMMFKDGLATNAEQDILSFADQLTKAQKHSAKDPIDFAKVSEQMEEYFDDFDEMTGAASQKKPEKYQ